MSQVLSQSEVDALLAAVSDGELSEAGEGQQNQVALMIRWWWSMISPVKTELFAADCLNWMLFMKNSCVHFEFPFLRPSEK